MGHKAILLAVTAMVMVVIATTLAFAVVRATPSGSRELPVVAKPIIVGAPVIDPCDFGAPLCRVLA